MNLPTIRPALAVAGCGAFLLIGTSAALGAYFGFTVGAHKHEALGAIFALAALGGELCKPFAVAAVLSELRAREFGRAIACLILAAVCVVYSVTSELALVAASRGDLSASRQADADKAHDARAKRDRLLTEYEAVPAARPIAELRPLIVAKLGGRPPEECDGWVEDTRARAKCADVAPLRAEATRAERRAAIQAQIDAAEALLGKAPVATTADPLAASLSAYAQALGSTIKADTLSPWLALIPVLFLEFGSAFALVLVRSVRASIRAEQKEPAAATVAKSQAPLVHATPVTLPPTTTTPLPSLPVPSSPALPAPETSAAVATAQPVSAVVLPLAAAPKDATLAKLRAAAKCGRVEGSQAHIARAIGMPTATAHRELHRLARDGAIRLRTTPRGTVIHFA